jgi:lipopolysaccharide/colanic/teichoic acid biosynthesis glycosyltransferase
MAIVQRFDYLTVPPSRQQARARIISEDLFRGVLIRERRRADRSNRPLALVLVVLESSTGEEETGIWQAVADALFAAKRETDIPGWFEPHSAMGLLLAEIPGSTSTLPFQVREQVHRELFLRLDARTASRVSVRLHVHPESQAAKAEGVQPVDLLLEQGTSDKSRRTRREASKRALDVVLSLGLLAIISPLLLVIAALVKLTSPGPVFLRQERIGRMMKPFRMLKFRTMQVNADHTIHRQFVSAFIKASGRAASDAGTPGFFKIVNDPRVTMVGRILRRTSLDELPQLWNVLRGEMSLVGPRPPLPYEVEQYEPWHTRRVVEAKPGVTGLWQVTGRSRTTFEEMVRLDLRYARTHSLWTDLKILLATPAAVISGKGAC